MDPTMERRLTPAERGRWSVVALIWTVAALIETALGTTWGARLAFVAIALGLVLGAARLLLRADHKEARGFATAWARRACRSTPWPSRSRRSSKRSARR
jgi:hypothetical protein